MVNMDTRLLITDICQSSSLTDALFKFKLNLPILKGCKIVFASPKGPVPGYCVNKTFSAGAVVRSLFKTERVLILDEETIEEMGAGSSTFPADFSISLETQALSYLEPFFNDRLKSLPSDFLEIFSFISRVDVDVNPLPYILENLFNLRDQKSADKIFGKLKAYEILRTLDTDWLNRHGAVRSILSASEINKKAQESIVDMYRHTENVSFMESIKFRQQYMYANLLKMSILQIKNRSQNLSKKVRQFIEFCDAELSTLGMRQMVLARVYFERGQNFLFFGNIQAKKKDIFDQLDNMAWDLWHLQQLEELLTIRPNSNARYFFPALLTFDKKFIEIIDLYPLKACAYFEGEHEPIPVFDGDFLSLIASEDTDLEEYVERLYAPDAIASRHSRRDQAKKTLGAIIADLENELERVAFVSKQQTQ